MAELAVVLISKNQAWNMARLLESVLCETCAIPTAEILLVDSASTDAGPVLARAYPIRILRLRPDQPLTPAAGRYMGYKHTTADAVLFLDGDMELNNGWLALALQILRDQPDVAVVTGLVVDLPKTGGSVDRPPAPVPAGIPAREIPQGGGAALYRRAVLEQVGTFNPYLESDEEPELCMRIRHAGYRVLQLAWPIAYHYSHPSTALSTVLGRWRRNLYLGYGQIIRYHLGSPLFWMYLKERGYSLVPGLGLAAGLFSLGWGLARARWVLVRLWTLLSLLTLAGYAYRKRSMQLVFYSLLQRLCIIDGAVRGFFLAPRDPDSYPGRFDLIEGARA
jgi:glycosyltransferase involved in cell wall biosynthesis